MGNFDRKRFLALRYGCAVVSVALALGLQLMIKPVLGQQIPFAILFLALAVTAWYGGLRPALLALLLGALGSDFFLLGSSWKLEFKTAHEQIGMGLFLAVGLAISLLAGAMHSARKRAESVARSSRFHDALINQTYEPVLMWEWDGPILLWNHGAEQLYGFKSEEALGRVSHDLLQTETLGGVASFVDAVERLGWWEGELKHISKDGETIIVDSHMVLIRETDRSYVIEANRDITQRKIRERELRDARDVNVRLEALTLERTAELSRSTQNLRASEERTRLILEGVRTHAIFMLDAVGNVASWNLGAERLKGYRAEEIVGQHFSRFYTPEDIESGKPDCELQIATREGFFEEEGLRVRKDGSRLWAVDSITALNNGGSEPIGFVKVVRDITERKTLQEALRNAENKFQLLVNGVTDLAILMLDPAGNILTWSRGAEIIDGYTADEIIGQHYSCLFTPESIQDGEPARELEQAAAEGKVDIEGWRIRKNGSRFWVNGTLAALYDENGKARGFAKVTRDLTAKRHNDELLQSVLNNTLDAIVTIDEKGTVSMINRAGAKLFGRPESEVVGQNVNMLMPDPYHKEHDGYLANYMQTGIAKIIGIGREVQGLRKDGSVFPLDLAVTEFRLENKRYFVGILRDISDRKKLEAQLQQSQKMEAFGQLAGGVAHDFNNLLTVISGYANLLFAQLPASDPKTKMIDQIRLAGERAASLTRQLLAFSRRQILEPRILDVNDIVRDIEKMLRRLIGEDLSLTTVLGSNLHSVKVDPGQLGQVITNLCLNSRDAMPQGGKITIETSDVELDESYVEKHQEVRCGQFVLVAISDTGCGMTPEVMARVFEPFFTTKGVGHGTGLGLAVVHGIIKQSGGSIEVYSEVGVGTTFKIYLPAIQQQTAVLFGNSMEPPLSGSGTILLVEDEESLRELGVLILEECGYTVLEASDGEAALRIIANDPDRIDLLVTDVVMPQMGGRKLAEILREKRPELRVLFMSGYTDDAVVRHGVLQANVNFLQKPFSPSALSKRVREILDQK